MFVQIVTFSTDDITTVETLLRDYMDQATGLVIGADLCTDADIAGRYFLIVAFDSAVTAGLNNELTATHEMDKKLRELCTGGPVYMNMEHRAS